MAGYLVKQFKGTFRIRADYDLSTNDFIRDSVGNLEPSFDDFYIKCKAGKVRYYQKKELLYFCNSIGKFKNILKQVYIDKIGDIEKVKIEKSYNYSEMYKDLLSNGIITFIEELDGEAEFHFNVNNVDYFSKLLNFEKKDANLSPFSTKNLPKKRYDIPVTDLSEYKEIIKNIPKSELYKIAQITKKFDEVIMERKGIKYDIIAEKRLSCLKSKEFIHSIGLWKEYIIFLKNNIDKQTFE